MNEPSAPAHLPHGPIRRQVLLLALPMLGEQVLNFLVGLVDTILAGRISKEATTAVGVAAYMGWIITLSFTLVGVGAAAVVSRAFGAADPATARRALHQSVLLAALFGVATAAISFASAELFAGWMTRTPAAYGLCVHFVRIVSAAYALSSINMVGAAVLRAAGNPRTPLQVMCVVNLVNVLLSTTLAFGLLGAPRLGVTGIAIGMLAARCAGGLLMLAVLCRGVGELRLVLRELAPQLDMIARILRIGLPAAGESALMAASQLLFVYIIAHTAAGDAATANMAAHMIAMEIEAISYLPAYAWGIAASTLCGQYLGAQRPDLAARAGHTAALQGLALGVAVGLTFFALAEPLYTWISVDAQVRAVGPPAFRLLAFAQPFLVMCIVYINALRGAGDTRWPMWFSLIGGFALRVPIAYLGGVVLGGGLIGAWCGMWADNVGRFILGFLRFRHGGWKRARV